MFKINVTAFNNGANLMVMKDALPECLNINQISV